MNGRRIGVRGAFEREGGREGAVRVLTVCSE